MMTKKVRHWKGRSKTTSSIIKNINKDNFAGAICPTNVEEQKQKFLTLGKTPEFTHKGTTDELEEIYSKPRSEIRFDYLGEALHILKMVKEKYGDAENYYYEMYGETITKEEATDVIVDYLKENHLDGAMSIIWCTDLPCSGRMMWQGPHVKYKRPEARKYSMWIKDSKDNNFLREKGMRCLADHEIGTHFFRSHNDGLQPWFAERNRFGIRGLSGLEQLRTEEGLAAINTILNAKVRYLWGPALLYYIACKATEMTFKQLFDHLSIYVQNPDWRWRHCVRVKRGLLNPNDIGGYGKDQCYFEGAVEILRNVDTIDFKLLMSGKVCYDEIQRIKKLARLDCIMLPAFMRNQDKYKKSLKQIAYMNGLNLDHAKYKAPVAYLRRLKRGRRIGVVGGVNKVRKKGKKGDDLGNGVYASTRFEVESDDDDEMSLSDDEQMFFDNFKIDDNKVEADKFFTSVKMSRAGANGTGTEADYTDYLKNVVSNYKKLKTETIELVKPESQKSPPKTEVKEEHHQEPGLENNREHYRCLSRGSIRSILNQPSCSLGSRGSKPASNIDLTTSTMNLGQLTRQGSDSGPESVISTASTTAQSHLSAHSTTTQASIPYHYDRYNLNKNAILPSPPAQSATLQKHMTPLGTPLVGPHCMPNTAHSLSNTALHSLTNTAPHSMTTMASHSMTTMASHSMTNTAPHSMTNMAPHSMPQPPLKSTSQAMPNTGPKPILAHTGLHSASSVSMATLPPQHNNNSLTKSRSSAGLSRISMQQSAGLTKAASSNDVVNTQTEGFIYPSSDILTDDIIQIKDGNQSGVKDQLVAGSMDSTRQVKLLTRRVQSATNHLAKLQN